MSGPSFEEMEAKRQEMIASFKDIAAAMTRCVSIIEDYTRLSPSSLPTLNSFSGLPTLSAAELARAVSTIDATSIPVEKKKRNKAEKKPKDPNAPKRPPSAYILYQNEVRDALRSERPELAYKDILALISEKWKALPDAERKVFEGKYVDAQNQFKTLDDAYKSGAAGTKPVPAAAVGAVAADSSDSSDDSDSSDEDDSLPASTPFQQQAYLATPQHSAAGAVAPSLLNSAQATLAATPDVKKEKKRKNKDVADVTATPLPAEDDKKKRKKKSKD